MAGKFVFQVVAAHQQHGARGGLGTGVREQLQRTGQGIFRHFTQADPFLLCAAAGEHGQHEQ